MASNDAKRQTATTNSLNESESDVDKPSRQELILSNFKPSIALVAVSVVVYLLVGSIGFYIVRGGINGKKTNAILDSLYLSVMTMTTVGYGDLEPDSDAAKLISCLFVFIGMSVFGLALTKVADYLVYKQQKLFIKALQNQKPGRHETKITKHAYKLLIGMGIILVLVLIGTVFLATVEGLDAVDAIYCVCTTITTLGYGDKSFSTTGGRVFGIFWMLSSSFSLAQFFIYIADEYIDTRQRELVDWFLSERVSNCDIEAADFNQDKIRGVADFIIRELKEMGKVSEEDIMKAMEGQ